MSKIKWVLIIGVCSILCVVGVIGVVNYSSGNYDDSTYYDDSAYQDEYFEDDFKYDDESMEEVIDDGYGFVQKTEVPDGWIGIDSVDELIQAGNNTAGNYILMCDLDLSEIADWSPIRNYSIFDGNGYTIENLTSSKGGLFSACHEVRYLNLENVNINVSPSEIKGDLKIGALVNGGFSGSIYNCLTSGTIKLNISETVKNRTGENSANSSSFDVYVGGIAGRSGDESTSIENCTSEVDIEINDSKTMHFTDYVVGGILGYSYESSAKLIDCKNYGSLDINRAFIKDETGFQYRDKFGGVVGETSGEVQGCINYGTVSSYYLSGGIIGSFEDANYIESCLNFGDISTMCKNSSSGGILANYAFGNGTINCCENYGAISADVSNPGSILGFKNGGNIDIVDCTYIDNTSLNEDEINITGTGEMYPDSNNNVKISLEEAKQTYPEQFS